MNASWPWIVVPLAPLLAAFLLLVLPTLRDRLITCLWVCCLPALVLAILPVAPVTFTMFWPGVTLGGADVLTRGWLAFTAILWASAGIAAAASMRSDDRRLRFWLFWLFTFSGNLLLIIALDALSFYVGFSVMSLSAYGLIIHRGGPRPRRAGRLYLQLAVIAEILLLTGIILRTHNAGGSFLLSDWNSMSDPLTILMLLCGAGIKAGFWPLHMWLPQAHPVAPAPASAVLSGAMLKAGILGLWRFLPGGDPALESWGVGLIAVGFFSAFYAVVVGLGRQQVKEVLAYSSVSQMGYLLMLIGLHWLVPQHTEALGLLLLLYAAHHAFSKGALFLGAGMAGYTMTVWRRRLFLVLLAIPALAMAGLFLSSGAGVKLMLKDTFGEAGLTGWTWLLSLGSLATALLLLRAWLLLYGMTRRARDGVPQQVQPHGQPAAGEFLGLAIPVALLIVLPLAVPALYQAISAHLSAKDLFDAFWPLVLAVLIALLALRRRPTAPFRLPKAFDPQRFSLNFRRLLLWPPLPHLQLRLDRQAWRQRERRWNRFWQGEVITRSAGMLLAFLIIAAALFALL